MVKTDSNKKVSSTTADLIGTYIVMRQMTKSAHEKRNVKEKMLKLKRRYRMMKRRCPLLTTAPTADLELKIQVLMKLKL